jgi:hypothetical protein
VEIKDFQVPLLEIAEHHIVPLENGKTVRTQLAFLARLIELDLFEEMKTGVNPMAYFFVPPSAFVI